MVRHFAPMDTSDHRTEDTTRHPVLRKVLIDLSIMMVLGVVLAVMGPFGSFEMPLPVRLLYWVGLALVGYACYRPIGELVTRLGLRLDLPEWSLWIVACLLASVPVTLAVFFAGQLPGPFALPSFDRFARSYPYVLLTVRASLLRIDPSLEESSRGLGHNAWSTFFQVVLHQLRPSIAAGALLVALYSLSDFGAVSLLRYETFTWAIYQQYQSAFDRSIAAVLSLILVGAAVTILLMEGYARGRQRYYRTGAGSARRACSIARSRVTVTTALYIGPMFSGRPRKVSASATGDTSLPRTISLRRRIGTKTGVSVKT